MWIIDPLVTHPNLHLGAPAHPFSPEVLQTKECGPIPYTSAVFTLDSHSSPSRSLGVCHKCILDLHPDWVVFQQNMANTFNSVSRIIIFQKLCVVGGDIIQLIPFTCAFYAFESPLFYSHYNCEGEVMVIPSTMGTRQGDPLGGALFALVHFRTLCSIANHFPSCLFPFIADNIHIISPPSIVSFAYEHFQIQLHGIGFLIKPQKCATWSPYGMLPNFDTPSLFNTPSKGIRVLGFHWVLDLSHHFSSKMFY